MTRSWWGWGNVEDACTQDERQALVNRVHTLLPNATLKYQAPPNPHQLPVPPPRIQPPATLQSICETNQEDRLSHARGKAYRDVARNLAGDIGPVPDVITRPRTEQEVVDVLDWCTTNNYALIPYGGGTSVVAGVEPRCANDYPGVVTLDTTNLNQVIEVDKTSRAARIQGGVLGPHLEQQLKPHDLTLRHFPQSFEFSTLGGWLATRAGGHFATLYTHIDDLTESMRVVTPHGISESRRLPGSGAGPSPDRMFLGSEGALGIITEAWMRLHEPPRWRKGTSIRFDDWSKAVQATRAVAQAGLYPANCRLLDPVEAFLNAGSPKSVLVLAFESSDHPVDEWLKRAVEITKAYGGEPDEEATKTWRRSFLRMPYQRDALAQHGMIAETFETACTWDRFEQLHAAITEAAGTLITCRFTHVYPDGPAPYYGVYTPGDHKTWDEIKARVSEAITDNGGTITHHHAVGRDHRPWYDRQRPEPFAHALKAAKQALDPAQILNPGVLV